MYPLFPLMIRSGIPTQNINISEKFIGLSYPASNDLATLEVQAFKEQLKSILTESELINIITVSCHSKT